MTDLDQALHERGARWTAQQPTAPDLDHALEGALDERVSRRPSPRATVLAVAAAVLVVASVAATLWLRRTPVPSADETPVPTEVIAKARSFAASNGDPSPNRIAIVDTTYARAASVLFDEPGRADDEPVWAVEMTGSFVCGGCKIPAGAQTPDGDVLTVVVNVRSGRIADYGLGNRWVDLSSLGDVREIVPAPEPPPDLVAAVRGLDGLDRAELVRTTPTQAERLITFVQPPAAPDQIWVVAEYGTFRGFALGPGAPGAAHPTVAFLLRVYGELPDGSIAGQSSVLSTGPDSAVDLNALGPVVTVEP